MISRALFDLNASKPAVFEAVRECAKLCLERQIELFWLAGDAQAQALSDIADRFTPLSALHRGDVDVVFVFGGDGTVLRALSRFSQFDVPVLGINLGRLGFLLEIQMQELAQALDMLVAGDFSIERRMMLHVEAQLIEGDISAYAVNEVAISRGMSQRMIALDALVGQTLVDHYIADGVMVSSPTGSTGYSLSSGGPIVSPDVDCFVLNPICPHTLQSRPIVLSHRERITLRLDMIEERDGIQLSIDGQLICCMRNREQVTVSRSKHDALLVRFPKERNFFTLLKDKLSQWSL